MTKAQFENGAQYAEDNFLNDNAPHLKVDKRLIRERFDLTAKRILDFGCGMGGMTLWYATHWDCFVHGLDIDRHHIEIATYLQNKHGVKNVKFEQRNVLHDPIAERYDYVFLNDVVEHIPFPVLEAIFRQLAPMLAPGGAILCAYPPWRSPYASHVQHVTHIPWCQFLPQRLLYRLIERNNLTIVGDIESNLLEAYKGLNHMTHEKLVATAAKAGLHPSWRKSHCFLNKLPGLKDANINFFPLDFLVTKEFLLLKR